MRVNERKSRHDDDGGEMQILADDEFDRVHVDRVDVAARGRGLVVVVLVDESIELAQVQKAVPQRVEEVVHEEEHWEGHNGVERSRLRQGPLDLRARPAVAQRVVGED